MGRGVGLTWVCAVSNVLGSCALYSDVQVTFPNGDTKDLIQKAYPFTHSLAAGFAGSVNIGFSLLDSLASFLQRPPGADGDPRMISITWAPLARSVFENADEMERRFGAQILIVAASPNENCGLGAKIYFTRFASPDFKPGIMAKPFKFCSIGSGAQITAYHDSLRPLFKRAGHMASLQADARGGPHGWVRNLSFRLSFRLANHPRKGISRHMHTIIVGRKLMEVENNDENIYPPNDGPRIEIRTPPVAQSYKQFTTFAASSGYEAAGAVC
jgi:hypothetical protein